MNLHRWCLCAAAACIFMLLGVSAAYGQQFSITISPTNPVAGQTIRFTVSTGAPGRQFWFAVVRITHGENCIAEMTMVPAPPTAYWAEVSDNATGFVIVTLQGGLPTGSYAVGVSAVGSNGRIGCWDMDVAPPAPVPEFNGTLIVFSLSLAALYCILQTRRIKRRKS